jgi:hypothetical protein
MRPILDEVWQRYHYDALFHAKVQTVMFNIRETTGLILDANETDAAIRYIGATLILQERAEWNANFVR